MGADPGIEISLWVDRQDRQRAEEILADLGALAVTLVDAGDHPVLEPAPGEHPLWPELIVTGYFPPGTDSREMLNAVRAQGFEGRTAHRSVGETDWETAWMQDAEPMRFGERLWVVPTVCEVPGEAEAVVKLDPGLAFGTGTHPTTRMCLEFLDALDLRGKRVLDFGCGSGILALAAARLDAAEVVAVDIDSQAEEATRRNVRANGLTGKVQVRGVGELAPGEFEVVVANILAGALADLAPLLARLSAGGARLALSGLLSSQFELIEQAYAVDFEEFQRRRLDDWLLVTARRRSR